MKHRITVVMVALLLLSLLLPCAFADDTGLAIIDAKQNTEDYSLQINIANALADADKVDNYKVTLGGNVLKLRSVTASSEEPKVENGNDNTAQASVKNGTSWIFLVDVSTVSTDKNTSYPLTDTLDALIDMIGINDNAALVTTAMSSPEDLTKGHTSLKNQMKEATKFDKTANRLYDSVIESLDFLMSSDKAMTNKSLVVLSKGDNKNGYASLNDVLDKIVASDVAVYTVAYIDAGASRDFGSMAQESIKSGHGGAEINKDTVSSAKIQYEAASIIQRAERDRKRNPGENDVTIPANATAYVIQTERPDEEGVDSTLVVSFKDGDLTTSAAYVIEEQLMYPKKGFFEWLISGLKQGDIACVGLVAGAAVLLVLIVVLIIRAIGKKNRKQDQTNYNVGEVVPPPVNDVSQAAPVTTTTPSTIVGVPQRRRLQLSLREASGKSHRAILTAEGISAGRQGDNHVVLDSEDKHISRHHFTVKLSGEEVILEGISETNGTYVNGMRIEGPIALRQQDIIRVGETEMTVTWKYV